MPLPSPYWRRRREFLRSLPLFASATDAELRVFDRLAGEVWVERGTDLIREGARGVEFAVITDGRVVVERAGRELALLEPGDFVGELALLEDRARTATVRAVARTRLLVLGVDEFDVVMRDVPAVRLSVGAAAAVRRDGVPVVPAPAFAAAGRSGGTGSRRRRLFTMALALAALAATGAGWWVMSERTRTTTVDLDDALADYRAQPAAAPAATAAATPTPAALAHPPTDSRAAAVGVPGNAREDADRIAPVTTVPAGPSMVVAGPPAPGVYAYATDGSESISILGGRHAYPARTFSVVRATGGCGWEVEHRIVDEHVDRRGRCTDPDALALVFEGREVEFFGQRDGLRYRCDPATARLPLADTPGTVRRATCETDGDAMDMTVTRQPSEPVDVGGTTVDTVRLHVAIRLRGRAEGTSTVDFWLHPLSGLIVKEHRVVDTQADAAFGDVRYREEVTLRLESLTPAR